MKTSYCKTLVEFYDGSGMCNIVGPLSFRPGRVIYLCRTLPDGDKRDKLSSFIKGFAKKTSVLFIQCDDDSPTDVIGKLQKMQKICGSLTVELTGGGEGAAFAAGLFVHCTEGRTSSVVRYDFARGEYRWFTRKGKKSDDVLCPDIRLNISQLFAAAGGEVTGFGRVKPKEFTPELCSYIMNVWKVFERHCDEWSRFASYMQFVVKKYGKEKSLYLSAPLEACVNDKEKRRCSEKIIDELAETGVIYGLKKTEKQISFRFRNELLRYFLCDGGMWLELYCRVTAMNTDGGKFYDDCAQSVLVKWGGEGKNETTNEIDCVVTKGMRSVFISCKLATPQVSALNEIRTLTDRFGGEGAHAMLVTMGNLSSPEASHIIARAAELGITLVGRETLKSGCFGEVLKETLIK